MPNNIKHSSAPEFSSDNLNELEKDIKQLNDLFKKIQSKHKFVTEFKISNYKSKFYRIYSVIHLNQ